MNIQSAITHAREVAKRNREQWKNCPADRKDIEHQTCEECAEEHEQLLEWLLELQQYRATGLTAKMVETLKENDRRSHQIAVRYATELDEYQAIGTPEECREARKRARKLAELEDMEEAGLLLKLPCKVSSTVHIIDDFEKEYERPAVVTGIEIDEDEIYIMISDGPQTGPSSSYTTDDFGDTVFLTRDEAEARLRELMEGGVEC